MIKVIIIIFAAEVWGGLGHVFFRKSAGSIQTPDLRDHASYVIFIHKILRQKLVWMGFCLVVVRMCLWLLALAHTDLSIAFPIDSVQYIIILAMSGLLLGEKIDKYKVMGTLLVTAGIVLVSLS